MQVMQMHSEFVENLDELAAREPFVLPSRPQPPHPRDPVSASFCRQLLTVPDWVAPHGDQSSVLEISFNRFLTRERILKGSARSLVLVAATIISDVHMPDADRRGIAFMRGFHLPKTPR